MSLWSDFSAWVFRSLPGAGMAAQGKSVGALGQAENIPWLSLARTQNPNLDTGTEAAGSWLELESALADPKAASCLDLRCQVLMGLPWQVQPREGTPPEAVDLVRRALERLDLPTPLEQMGRASYFGVTPLEVTWGLVNGEMLPDRLEAFHPYFLSFDQARRPLVQGKALEPGKLIVHQHGNAWRNPWGMGRGRTVPRWVRVKIAIAYATYRDYPDFCHDRLHFTYPSDADVAEQNRYIQIAQSLLKGPGIVTPEGMAVNPIKLENQFEEGARLMEAADAQIATAILGTTLTTGEGRHGGIGSGAPANQHGNQDSQQKAADAIRVQATLNRTLVPWIVALNLGPNVVPPQLVFDHDIDTELKDLLGIAQGLGDRGLAISKAWARRVFGIPEPTDEEDTLILQVAKAPAALSNQSEELILLDASPSKGNRPADQEPGNAWGVIDTWAQGYRQRAAATYQHAARAIRQAKTFGQALEGVATSAADFPTSAATWAWGAFRAARDLAAYEVAREAKAVQLADEPWTDFSLAPELALRWLASRVPTSASQVKGLTDEDLRARAFWLAGVDQLGILQDLQQSMVDALAQGRLFDDWKRDWLGQLPGVNARQLETAFRTNTDGAYGASRYAQLMASPLVESLTYVTAGDEKVRPEHRLLDGVTRPKDDPFWASHTPPLGYNCRCTLRASSSGDRKTPDGDSRLGVPPTQGFGQGGESFRDYLQALADAPSAGWSPMPATADFAWTSPLQALGPLQGEAKATPQTWPAIVQDPSGRGVAYLGGDPEVAGALEAPAELWLRPVHSAEGRTGLQLVYLLPQAQDQVLVVLAQDGVVPGDGGAVLTPDPTPYRTGARLR